MSNPKAAVILPDSESEPVIAAGRTLIQLAHVIVRLEDRALSKDLGLSYRQIRILKHINAGIVSGTELARIFGVTAPAISETLELLVRKGLIRRKPHATDRRAVKLVLTAAGSSVNEEAEQAERTLAREVLGPLDVDEIESLLGMASKLLPPSQEMLISSRQSTD